MTDNISQPPPTLANPASPGAQCFASAVGLMSKNRPEEAYTLFVGAVTQDPTHAGAYFHIGSILYATKKFHAAVAALTRVNQLHPNEPRVLTNLGWYRYLAEDVDGGHATLKRAIELGPELALAWTNLSQVQVALGDLDSAIKSAQRGLDLSTGEPIHGMAVAFTHLFRKELQLGLKAYESRFRFKLHQFLTYPYKKWAGEPANRLFIQAEQGIGDDISMLRFLPEVCKRAEKIILFINKELQTLVENMKFPNVEVHPVPSVLPMADAWSPLMSLPLCLNIDTPDLVKFAPPYIPTPEPALAPNGLRRIALCWAGSPANDLDRWRSMPLQSLLALASLPGTELLALQVGPAQSQIAETGAYGIVTDLSPYLTNMYETTRILAAIDIVITVDTALAHLSCAMGKTTYVLRNRRASDWRWAREGQTSDWYPAAKIFERDYHESWDDVVTRVITSLTTEAIHG